MGVLGRGIARRGDVLSGQTLEGIRVTPRCRRSSQRAYPVDEVERDTLANGIGHGLKSSVKYNSYQRGVQTVSW